jgi:serine/threonine-protein kinase
MDLGTRLGSRLAGYRIERMLGRGGMGVVYLAEQERLHRPVALKVITPELADDGRFRRRFLRESEIAASIDHPHVIPVYDAGESDGVLYLAMRYVEGTDLASILRGSDGIPPAGSAPLISHIAAALDCAHSRGLIHRDVKPGNVLVSHSGDDDQSTDHVYLSDFGLGTSATSLRTVTSTGQVLGSIEYLAPEVISGEPASAAADQYALACLAYQCLTGQVPYPRENGMAVLWAHVHEPVPRVSALRPDLDPAFDDVIAHGMAKAPEDRYDSCGAFARAFVDAAQPPAVVHAPSRPRRSSRLLLLAGLAAAAIAVAVVIATRSGSSAPSAVHSPAPPRVHVAAQSVAALDPATMSTIADIHVGGMPAQLASGAGKLWIADSRRRAVLSLDPASGHTHTISTRFPPTALTFGGGRVWALLGGVRKIALISPNRRVHVAHVPLCCQGTGAIAADKAHVWAAIEDTTVRVAIRSGRADGFAHDTGSIGLVAVPPAGAAGRTVLWDTDGHATVWRRTSGLKVTATKTVANGGADGRAGALTFYRGHIWVVATALNQVWRFAPRQGGGGNRVIQGIDAPTAIAAGAGYVWVASASRGTVTRIDPDTLAVRMVRLSGHLGGIAVAGGRVWVAVQPTDAAKGMSQQPAYSNDGQIIGGGNVERGDAFGWAPDGTRLVYARGGHLWVARADGIARRQLTSGPEADSAPAWSPNGAWIAFVRSGTSGSQIWTVRSDGSDAHPVTPGLGEDLGPAWSPDGATIAYSHALSGEAPRLWVVHDTGTVGVGAHPEASHLAGPPAWSPDGTELAYWSTYQGSGVYLLRLHQSVPAMVVNIPGSESQQAADTRIAWSPDGRTLIVVADGRAWAVYADGSGLSPLPALDGATSVAYRPATP